MSNKNDELLSEYDLDYSKSKSNSFANKYRQMQRTVVLDSDVAENFPSAESVNEGIAFFCSRYTGKPRIFAT